MTYESMLIRIRERPKSSCSIAMSQWPAEESGINPQHIGGQTLIIPDDVASY